MENEEIVNIKKMFDKEISETEYKRKCAKIYKVVRNGLVEIEAHRKGYKYHKNKVSGDIVKVEIAPIDTFKAYELQKQLLENALEI